MIEVMYDEPGIGLAAPQVGAAIRFFTVANQSSQSSQMSRKYGLKGVPSLVVDGKYLVSGRMGSTPQETISTLDELIKKVRKERIKK